MRFLHTADLHLDSPLRSQAMKNPALAEHLHAASRAALGRIVTAAIEHQVDAVLLAGDLFDSAVVDVAARAALSAEMGRLSRARIPALVIQGNHDALLDLDRFGPIAENVIILNKDQPTYRLGDASIHGIGFSGRHVADSLLPQYPAPEPGRLNLGMMHTSLGGAVGHDPYAPCNEADLLAHGYSYWALGHIHQRFERRSERALAVMPGIPQGRSIRETGIGSVTLVEADLDGVRAKTLPIALVQFHDIACDFAHVTSQADAIRALSDALAQHQSTEIALAARLRVAGQGAQLSDPALLRALAEEAAQTWDNAYIEAVRQDHSQPAAPLGVLNDLAQMMLDDTQTVGFRDEALALLQEWRRALPREAADVLNDAELDELLTEGTSEIVARMAREAKAS